MNSVHFQFPIYIAYFNKSLVQEGDKFENAGGGVGGGGV